VSSIASPIQVLEVGLACCGVEASAATLITQAHDTWALSNDPTLSQHVLVIAGTLTHALANNVQAAFDSVLEPRVVIAFGACAIGGGPYWDSYSVINGADQLIPVDIYVPGCPPTPSDLVSALEQAAELVRRASS